MRVVIVSRIYRPEPSAASLFLGAIADELVARGAGVTVLTAVAPAGHSTPGRGAEVRRFPVLRDRDGYVRGYVPYLSFDIPLAFRLLFVRKPDVVLVEPPPTTGTVTRLVCGLRRIPYVYDAADIWSDAADMATGSRLVIRVVRAMEVFALRGAAAIVTISDGVAKRIRELAVSVPTTVTGFGADTSEFSVTERPTERLFLYAGSYAAWHGADMIVDAFADFSSSHPGYTLRFIGNGTERDVIEHRARELGVAGAIEFLGPMPSHELNPQFSAAVASLATLKPGTHYEYAFATKTYSSLAAGCPVVFAGPGPTADFLTRANRDVRAGAATDYVPKQMADAMRTLVDDPLDSAARSALGAWTDASHSLRSVAARVAEVVTEVARRRKRS